MVMVMESYMDHAEILAEAYFLARPLLLSTSVIVGICICKVAYHVTQSITPFYIVGYTSLSRIQQIEWNNRGISSAHAVLITLMSLYLIFFSDLFSDDIEVLIPFRGSIFSCITLGVSLGFFISDLGMMFWYYPSLGGVEYVLHHMLSVTAISYSMLFGEGQLYTFLILISEITTPVLNLRWYLVTARMRRTRAYRINAVALVFLWLVARIFLFIYLFYHIYLHYDEVKLMRTFGYLLTFLVPTALFVINILWFRKIVRGLKSRLPRR